MKLQAYEIIIWNYLINIWNYYHQPQIGKIQIKEKFDISFARKVGKNKKEW